MIIDPRKDDTVFRPSLISPQLIDDAFGVETLRPSPHFYLVSQGNIADNPYQVWDEEYRRFGAVFQAIRLPFEARVSHVHVISPEGDFVLSNEPVLLPVGGLALYSPLKNRWVAVTPEQELSENLQRVEVVESERDPKPYSIKSAIGSRIDCDVALKRIDATFPISDQQRAAQQRDIEAVKVFGLEVA